MNRELLQQVLDALETHVPHVYKDRGYPPIEALRAALAQPEPIDGFGGNLDEAFEPAPAVPLTDDMVEAEFVSRGDDKGQGLHPYWKDAFHEGFNFARSKLSAAPALREPLTDAQIDKIFDDAHENMPKGELFRTFVTRAIERAHGIGGGGK